MANKIKYRMKVIKILMPYAEGVRRYFGLLMLLNLFIMGIQFIAPIIYKIFINDVIIGKQQERMYAVIMGSLSVYMAEALMNYMKVKVKTHVSNTITLRVRKFIFDSFLGISFTKYSQTSIGDFKMRLDNDTKQIDEFSEKQTIDYLLSYVKMSVCVVMLFVIDWRLAIFSSTVIPLTFVLDNTVSKIENKLSEEQYENEKKWTTWLYEDIQGWREVKALQIAKHEAKKFYKFAHEDMIYTAKWMNCWTARARVIPKIKDEFLMQFCLYFLGGLLIIYQELDIGQLLVFTMYYSMFSNAVKSISNMDADMQAKKIYTDRLIEDLTKKTYKTISRKFISEFSDIIEFQNVSYKYPNADIDVLKGVSFKIEKGERVAIIGKSGSGKSTVLKLIAGVMEPTVGQVLYSGQSLSDLELSDVHKRIGFVMQESTLFHDTIEENLLYGKMDASEEEMKEACIKAGIYNDIKLMPAGLKTIIGENGSGLSGGQQQRIILARLFLQKKEIFILDEATSGLDYKTEEIVYDAIMAIPKDKTIIVVTHNENILHYFDKIITIRI